MLNYKDLLSVLKDALSILAILVPSVIALYKYTAYLHGRLSWREILKGIEVIHKKMNDDHYVPDLIICLGRSGSIVGSLLSGRFKDLIPIVTLNFEYNLNRPLPKENGKEYVRSEKLLNYCILRPRAQHVLLLGVDILTGSTMNAAIEELEKRRFADFRICSLFVFTDSGIRPKYYYKMVQKRPTYPWMVSPHWKSWSTVPGRSEVSKKNHFRRSTEKTDIDLFLIRHGKTTAENDVFCGDTDYELDSKGIKQAIYVGQKFEDDEILRIFHSPLARARSTATIIEQFVSNCELIEDKDIKEMSFGVWEGLSHKELKQTQAKVYSGWDTDSLNNLPEGFEDPLKVKERGIRFLKKVEDEFRNEESAKILAVMHQNIIRILLCVINRTDLSDYRSINILHGEIIHLNYNGNQWSLKEKITNHLTRTR